MKLTTSQTQTFWKQWNSIVAAQHWDRTEAEEERKSLLARAGFTSLTLVDKVKGFSRVLAELAAARGDLNGVLRANNNNRRVLLQVIRKYALRLGPEDPAAPLGMAYLKTLLPERFRTSDIDDLKEADLVQLRDTLADRCVEFHKDDTLRRRAAMRKLRKKQADPTSRITFPAPSPSPSPAVDPDDISLCCCESTEDRIPRSVTITSDIEV